MEPEPKPTNEATMAKTWVFNHELFATELGKTSHTDESYARLLGEMLPDDDEITRQSIYNWRIGKVDPRSKHLPLICISLNIPSEKILIKRVVA